MDAGSREARGYPGSPAWRLGRTPAPRLRGPHRRPFQGNQSVPNRLRQILDENRPDRHGITDPAVLAVFRA